MPDLPDNNRCDECILYRPHFAGGRKYCNLNRKEYAHEIDYIHCALIEQTHVNKDIESLHQPCTDAEVGTTETREIITTLRNELDHIGRRALGLAANQMHYDKRIAVIRFPNAARCTRELVMINPSILSYEEDGVQWIKESCLSIGNGMQPIPVPRAAKITLKYTDEDGKDCIEQFSFSENKDLVWAVQHEIDHLDGILLLDYMKKISLPKRQQEIHTIATARYKAVNAARHTPVRREGKKLGRNDPCYCGSGKKYKNCCME